MSYSPETLEKAVKLFNNAKSDLNTRGHATGNLESYLYSLRDKQRRPVGGCTATWIDNDESGDYTPALVNSDAQIGTSKNTRNKRSAQQERSEGLHVNLKLNSPEGKELLANISKDGVPPKEPTGKDYSSDSSTSWPTNVPLPKSKTPNQLAHIQGTTTTGTRRSTRISTRNQKGGSSTRSLLSLQPGDPETRGCKSCWENYHDCSLLKAPAVYPCQVCKVNRRDCELIIQPKQKRPCENCRRRKLTCSYAENTVFDRPCKQCESSRTECIAGPAEGQTSEQDPFSLQIGQGTTTANPSFLQRLQATENQPVADKRATSSLHLDPMAASSLNTAVSGRTPMMSESPVGLTAGNSAISTPSPSVRRLPTRSTRATIKPKASSHSFSGSSLVGKLAGSSRRVPGSSKATLAPSRSTLAPKGSNKTESGSQNTYEKQATSEQRRVGGKSIMIKTPFAHPINFEYVPPRNGSKPCHWCNDFTYGILGLGNLDVEVVKRPDGPGYVEVRGGHVGKGCDSSRMCTVCALERIHIGNCSQHKIFALKNLDEDTFDFGEAFLSLEPLHETSRHVPINPWCSLCPNPAFYGCATLQRFSKFREPLRSKEEEEGCGLLLCSDCAEVMVECDSNIAKTVREHRKVGRELRADVEFLLPHNDLYEAFQSRR